MALREELDNYNAEIVVGPEDDPQVTNAQLAVEEWNRTTVADGAWLQQNAIGPLSARDIVLANAIDDTNDALAELSGKMADVDGRSLKSINGRFFSGGSDLWGGSNDAIVPDGQYVKNDEVIYVPESDGVTLSMNDNAGHAHQLKIKENEIGYRYVAGASTAEGSGTIPGTKYKYDTQAGEFTKVLLKSDLPQQDTLYGIKSGEFVEIPSADNATIGINENNQLYVKHLDDPSWMKTSDGNIDASIMPASDESYIHGYGVTLSGSFGSIVGSNNDPSNPFVAKVTRSVLQAYGPSYADSNTKNITIEDCFCILDGGSIGTSSNFNNSIINAAGCGLYSPSIERCIMAGNFTATSGSDLSKVIFAGGGVKLGSSEPGADGLDEVIICGGGGEIYDSTDAIYIGNILSATNNNHLMVIGGSAKVKNSEYSVLMANGGGILNKIAQSLMFSDSWTSAKDTTASLVNANVSNIDGSHYDVVLGSNHNVQHGSQCNYVNGFRIKVPDDKAAPQWSIMAGCDLDFGSSQYTLGLGDFMQIKGSYNYNVGKSNSAYGTYAGIIGTGNIQGSDGAGYNLVIGSDNRSWASYSLLLGQENSATNHTIQQAIGKRNLMNGTIQLAIGEHNIMDGTIGLAIGADNNNTGNYDLTVGTHNGNYGNESFQIGDYNTSTNDKVIMVGNNLRTSRDMQVQIGEYNVGYDDSMLEISIGGNSTVRKTIFRVTSAGDVYCAGSLHTNQTSMTGN